MLRDPIRVVLFLLLILRCWVFIAKPGASDSFLLLFHANAVSRAIVNATAFFFGINRLMAEAAVYMYSSAWYIYLSINVIGRFLFKKKYYYAAWDGCCADTQGILENRFLYMYRDRQAEINVPRSPWPASKEVGCIVLLLLLDSIILLREEHLDLPWWPSWRRVKRLVVFREIGNKRLSCILRIYTHMFVYLRYCDDHLDGLVWLNYHLIYYRSLLT